MGFKQLRKAAGMNNFDPQFSTYDPQVGAYNNADGSAGNAGSATAAAQPGEKMQVNITLNNPAATTLDFEMFSYLDSFLRRQKNEYINGVYLYIPMLSYEGLVRTAADTGGTVGFLSSGDLCIRGDDSLMVPSPVATIGCSEINYNAFFHSSGIAPFSVAWIRETVTSDAQINQALVWFQRTFAGGYQENRISPRSYFRPNQFQDLIIDLPINFTIGIDSGVRMKVLSGNTVTLALFINAWTNQTIGQ